jgi:hypothetical protein
VKAIPWYRDRVAWRWIGLRFLPWFAALSLAWEIAQLPLYTIWTEASSAYIAFAVVHCTLGDLLIGSAALLLALLLAREPGIARWRWRRLALLVVPFGVAYTAFSEWLNTAVLGNWAYAASMPTIALAGADIGLSPLLQWVLLPPLALYLGRRALHLEPAA